MIQLVPDGVAEFNKRMVDMNQDAEGVRISFDDVRRQSLPVTESKVTRGRSSSEWIAQK